MCDSVPFTVFKYNHDKVQSVFYLPHLRDFEESPRRGEPWVVKGDGELKTICMFLLSLISLHCIFHFCRHSPRLVRLCPLVGTETLLASENALDSGQVWSPGRRKASLHPSAQNASPPPAQCEDGEIASQLLGCGL